MPRRNRNGEERVFPDPLPDWLEDELNRSWKRLQRERNHLDPDRNKRRSPHRNWMNRPIRDLTTL